MDLGTITPTPTLPLAEAVNQSLRLFTGTCQVSTARLLDTAGGTTSVYSVLLRPGATVEDPVAIDSVLAVLLYEEQLTLDNMRTAYERIRQAKARPKTKGLPIELEMMPGLIVARDSQLALEQISEEMSRLTATIPSQHWPDAVAVLARGIINYTAQDPAGITKGGDLFLPAPSLVGGSSPVPSVFVRKVIRATGDQTFNKVISLVLARIGIAQLGVDTPNFQDFLKRTPSHGISTETYQFDLNYALRVMTIEHALAAQLPRERFDVMRGKELLGSAQFTPWQDGGVLVVQGRFPIEGLLVYLPGISPRQLGNFRGPDLQVSFVLPISWEGFVEALNLFQRRSNMRVKRREPKGVVQTFADEGTASPFVSRLMLGVMRIRDAVYYDADAKARFDEIYEPVLSGLRDAREASKELQRLWENHHAKVVSGEIARVQQGMIYVNDGIDRKLKKELDSFLNTSVRVVKVAMQDLAGFHGVDIGFLFKKQATFQSAVDDLQNSDAILSMYLNATRCWSEPLVMMRNDLEHGTVRPTKTSYETDNGAVRAVEPTLGNVPITVFARQGLDRVSCFVEELTVYCLKKKLPAGIDITEQPHATRDESVPLRFHLTVSTGELPAWKLAAHEQPFDHV